MSSIPVELKNLPTTPGIYQFFNADGEIIYIGKSVHLRNRVSSYFNGKSKLNFAKKKMVEQVHDIQTIITNSETESLLLENTLIKKYQPKYNILLKDDKNYSYIKITDEVIPRVIKIRKKTKSGTYFGPYTSTNYVHTILKIIKKIFGYRSCNIVFESTKPTPVIFESRTREKESKDPSDSSKEILPFQSKGQIGIKSAHGTKIPCIDYYIGRCAAPCLLKKKYIDAYQEKISQIKQFLKGNYGNILSQLQEQMHEEARNLRFEEAAKLKKDIESLELLEGRQLVRELVEGDYDVVHIIEKYEKVYIGSIEIRNSMITGYHNYEATNKLAETKEEILTQYLEQCYAEHFETDKNVCFIIPFEIPKCTSETKNIPHRKRANNHIDSGISQEGQHFSLRIEVPKIGGKLELLQLCYKNIYEYATKKHIGALSTKGFTKKTMLSLLETLGYKQINTQITFECNDISHLSGTHTVASRSVIENGKAANSRYKKFRIKELPEGKIDDFSSMREIMTRRLKEIETTGYIPDLIIIDGGKGQLGAVMEVIEDYALQITSNEDNNRHPELDSGSGKSKNSISHHESSTILELLQQLQIVSIAKREEELFLPTLPVHSLLPPQSRRTEGEKVAEKEKSPFVKKILEKDSTELRLIQKIRDEAHRFAITFNRDSRNKAMKKNILESLPGFGPITRKKLLKKYGSIQNISQIPIDELSHILSKSQIQTLEDHGII